MTLVNGVAHTLAYKMRADRPAFQAIFAQNVMAGLNVNIFGEGAAHIKMIAPASQFEAIVSPR